MRSREKAGCLEINCFLCHSASQGSTTGMIWETESGKASNWNRTPLPTVSQANRKGSTDVSSLGVSSSVKQALSICLEGGAQLSYIHGQLISSCCTSAPCKSTCWHLHDKPSMCINTQRPFSLLRRSPSSAAAIHLLPFLMLRVLLCMTWCWNWFRRPHWFWNGFHLEVDWLWDLWSLSFKGGWENPLGSFQLCGRNSAYFLQFSSFVLLFAFFVSHGACLGWFLWFHLGDLMQ